MAMPLDQQEEETQQEEVSSDDVEILVRMGIQMLNKGGLDAIKKAIQESQDPAQVIGQFIAQLMGHLMQQLQSQIDIDPRAFLADNGFLDHILDYIETKLGYPEDFSDQIYDQVVEVVKAAAANPEEAVAGPEQQAPQQEEVAPNVGV